MDDLSSQQHLIASQLHPADTILSSSETVFLLARPWLEKWDRYTQREGPHPGQIDNSQLYALYRKTEGVRTAVLRKDLSPDRDFVYVSPFVWEKLFSWYGGGPEAELFVTNATPDWTPMLVKVDTQIDSHYFRVSLNITLQKLKKYVCKKTQLPEDKYELRLMGKGFQHGLTASLRTAGVKELDVFSLEDKSFATVDLQPIDEEDNGLESFQLPPHHQMSSGVNFPSDDVPEVNHGASSHIMETSNFRMDLYRDDKESVLVRISCSLHSPRTKLSIQSLSKTSRRTESLYEEWQREDVSR